MDLPNFSRALLERMDPSDNNLEDGELLNLKHGEDHVEGANTELTESDPSADVFAAATAVEVENQRAGLRELGDFCHGNNVVEGANAELPEPLPSAAVLVAPVAAQALSPLSLFLRDGDFYHNIGNEKEAMEEMGREFESHENVDVYFSNSNQQRGVEHPADDGNQADNDLEETTATHEHGSNNFADSRVSSIHRGNHRAGDAEAMASSQLVSTHYCNRGKDELDHIRNQKHSLINHKSSQGASCATLPEGIGDEDETQSTSAANIDGGEIVSDPRVPIVGMEFSSAEAVHDFYNIYAEQIGFKVRKGKAEYKNKEMKSRYFLCSCEGFKSQEQIDKPTRYKRPDTRTGCRAMIKCVRDDGTWKISKVFLEHNHPVPPGRAEDSCATTTALSMDKTVNKVKTVEKQALVSDADCRDVSQGRWKNHPMPEPEDTQDLINYFKNRQIEDPFFFHTAQVKAASMGNFFWRDSRSKIDYEHFGDVLVLDTITNKYDMICAVFWGLNNHRQRIIFGCAFLVDRTVDSLNWLLQSFLEAMSCYKPKTIITEVSEEITDALREVLPEPETSHCLPFWSILNGFRKNLPALGDRPSDDLLECVFNVHSQEKFELKWNSFVRTYKLHENMWLASLYGMRKKWSHAFTKNVFSAGIISIQNNEYARGIFENLSCESMTLSQIAQWCENMAKQMWQKEFVEDMHCEKITSNLQSKIPVEKEAERLYTRPIFKMFRKESSNILLLAIEEIGGMAPLREFKLTEEGSTEFEIVKFDPSNSTLVCSCGKFESVGILCFHALKVLNFMNIFEIPSHYLLKRWRKSAKDSLPVDTSSAGPARGGGPVDLFTGEFMRKALHVAHMSVNKERKSTAMRFMDLALEHIAKAPKTEEVAAVCPRAKRKVGGNRRAGKRGRIS